MITTGILPGPAPFAHRDRCDRCGGEAQIRALLPTGGELQFCGHHARVHGPRLHEIGAGLRSTL